MHQLVLLIYMYMFYVSPFYLLIAVIRAYMYIIAIEYSIVMHCYRNEYKFKGTFLKYIFPYVNYHHYSVDFMWELVTWSKLIVYCLHCSRHLISILINYFTSVYIRIFNCVCIDGFYTIPKRVWLNLWLLFREVLYYFPRTFYYWDKLIS